MWCTSSSVRAILAAAASTWPDCATDPLQYVDTCINTSKNCMTATAFATEHNLAQTTAVTHDTWSSFSWRAEHAARAPVLGALMLRRLCRRGTTDPDSPPASEERVLRGHVCAGPCRRARFLPNEWF
ncbi:hypothetical protein PR003_g21596 [Phytophthora rubi]|uniref:Secreted protein n=1 Tax=Phytophthora rubi TaxID=129364 RepID=A0A6A4DCT7_9STRA|nr:hypothetical protein PR002_g21042 [Phytophthora rubi]KAE9305044.1 hypothetical protein PR003_g21596 [Phytophthora rubi]